MTVEAIVKINKVDDTIENYSIFSCFKESEQKDEWGFILGFTKDKKFHFSVST